MRSCKNKTALTLIEIVVVVAIVAILVSTVISVAVRINSQAREQLAESTIAILDAALEQFSDYEYQYNNLVVDYSAFDFPLDCNSVLEPDLRIALADALGMSTPAEILPVGAAINHLPEYSESEALYFFLNRVPQSRKVLNKIDGSLITNRDDYGNEMMIRTTDDNGVVRNYPLARIIDPWGRTLRYSYYDGVTGTLRTFPLVTSAGPDREFDTVGDNITNR